MSALDNIPENKNFLSPLNFRFQVKKCPNVNFFIQNVNLPGVTLVAVETPNPFVKIPRTGDHIEYEDLMINFKIDEDLKNYMEIFNWIRDLGFPDNFDQYKSIAGRPVYSGLGITSDLSLIVLSSSRNPIYELTFKDAFPITMSSVIFDSTQQDVQFVEAAVTFRYRTFTVEPIS